MSNLVDKLGGWPAVIGYILGVVGITATIVVYYLTKIRKTLDWQVLISARMVAPFAPTAAIKVVVNQEPLSNPNIVAFTIRNTGLIEIKPEDWDGAIEIELRRAIIKSVDITERSSPRVGGRIDRTIDNVDPERSVARLSEVGLLNRGEWFAVQLITEGAEGQEPICTARFAGQTRPMREATPVSFQLDLSLGTIAGLLTDAAVAALAVGPRRRR